MTHVEVTDVNGTRWIGDESDDLLTPEEADQLHDLLSHFDRLNHLTLTIGGNKHYFNPAHVVSVAIKGEVTA